MEFMTDQLRHLLKQYISDGMLNLHELKSIEQFCLRNDIDPDILVRLKNKVFDELFIEYLRDRRLSGAEFANLYHIALKFEFTDQQLEKMRYYAP